MDCSLNAAANFINLFPECRFSQALEAVWVFVRACNKYIDSEAPWALHKNGKQERLNTVMALLLAGMRKTALLLWPVMPDASGQMLEQLGFDKKFIESLAGYDIRKEAESFSFLKAGASLSASSNLFPRMELKATPKEAGAPVRVKKEGKKPEPGLVDIEVFKSLDVRTGTVLEASRHPDADRILVLKIDFGEDEPRQILSALAEHYSPDELIKRRVCALLNLKPRKIRGLVSNGMVLTLEDGKNVRLLEAPAEMPDGSKLA